MIDLIKEINLFYGILETIYMVFFATLLAYIFGLAIGIITLITEKDGICPNRIVNSLLNWIINIGRSVPFVIISLVLIPFTRFLIGTSWGNNAAIVSLSVAAMFFVARVVYLNLKEVDKATIEVFVCMGAKPSTIIFKVYIKESMPSIVRGVALTIINLVGYSSMAGALGAGGLGNIAYAYGYQKFRNDVMIVTLIVIIILVQIIQITFDFISKKIDKR